MIDKIHAMRMAECHSFSQKLHNWGAPWKNQTSRYISLFCPSLNGDLFAVLFFGGKWWSDLFFSQEQNKFHYWVSILSKCLCILIDCSQLSKCYSLNVRRYMSCAWWSRVYNRTTLTCCSVIAGFLPRHCLYEWLCWAEQLNNTL